MTENAGEKLLIEGRKRLQMTGVGAVEGFSEQTLKLVVHGGRVIISGKDIKITAFNKESGNFTAEGEFYDVKFGGEKQAFFKRIFK